MSNSLVPVVSLQNGKPMANSRDVAAMFEKRHDNVLTDIRRLISEGVLYFQETSYTHEQNGQTYCAFDMTRDGFALLAMGFRCGPWRPREVLCLPDGPITPHHRHSHKSSSAPSAND
ncbi:Rha family transcriptional regulator [Agrobacterium leguminum]